jgi:cytidylate kinase
LVNNIKIAIDGPSGSGKSTIAKSIAQRLNIDYIDTGAMYRAVAYKMLQENISADNLEAIKTMLEETDIDFINGHTWLDGHDVSALIRNSEVARAASLCSAIPMVREKLVELQRRMGQTKSLVMDGRDIGTNVFMDAEVKFFITASPEERARRRHLELLEKGEAISFEQVLESIKARDHNDTTRLLNPLRQAEDAILLDTTRMTIEEVEETIMKEVKKWQL